MKVDQRTADFYVGRILDRYLRVGGSLYTAQIPEMKAREEGKVTHKRRSNVDEEQRCFVASVEMLLTNNLPRRDLLLLAAFQFGPDVTNTAEERARINYGLQIMNMHSPKHRHNPKDAEWVYKNLGRVRLKLFGVFSKAGMFRIEAKRTPPANVWVTCSKRAQFAQVTAGEPHAKK